MLKIEQFKVIKNNKNQMRLPEEPKADFRIFKTMVFLNFNIFLLTLKNNPISPIN